MKLTTVKYYFSIVAMAFVSLSCVKDDVKNKLTTEGNTYFKVLEAPQNQIFFSPFTDIKSVDLFSLRKDAATSTSLHTSTTVTLNIDPSLISDYNNANGDTYEELPDSLFTLDPTYVKSGTTYTTTFASGDFAKEFTIKLNGAKWDLAHKYAIGVNIASVGTNSKDKIDADQHSILVLVSIKNQYAGTYTSNGYFYHPASPRALTNISKELVTAGPSSVTCDLGDLGANGYKALFTIDPATNNVTITAAPGAAGGTYTMFTASLPTTNPGYTPAWPGSAQCNNTYDPATKTFFVRYGYTGGTGYRVTEEIIKMD
jgi:Domain of unknown function (DUF1735)/Domain of unknown function (DUF4361)